jgi:hypothetical protein
MDWIEDRRDETPTIRNGESFTFSWGYEQKEGFPVPTLVVSPTYVERDGGVVVYAPLGPWCTRR